MKKDAEVLLMIKERRKGATQQVAAARSGMSERTLRKYEQLGHLPSQARQPRTYRTRANPFAEVWDWVVRELERDPALQANTLFALLQDQDPGRYPAGQLRTLQRHIAAWRAVHGPAQAVIFAQVPQPGVLAQSDFTHRTRLGITLAGMPFAHLLFPLVLPYSTVEAVQVCFSESFESLAEGLEHSLWQIGGVPLQHRTDHMSAAVRPLDRAGRQDFTDRYRALMAHYGMEPTANNAGEAHENGAVEQAHHRFKQAVDQALRVRGSRDFVDRAAYGQFLQELVRQRNLTRQARFATERQALRPLPAAPLAPCRELRLNVTRFSTIHVLENTYSVPSRLIGTAVLVRVRAETLEVYVGTTCVCTLPRLAGRQQHAIDYRHIIWSLVRKPGAFAGYRYRHDLYPSLIFRRAYDHLAQARPRQVDRDYGRILYLAASTSESEVDAALRLLLEAPLLPTFDAVRDLVRVPQASAVPALTPASLDLRAYDQLLPSRSAHA